MSDTGGLGGGLIGAFISRAIGEGMGVTAARNLFRETGIGRMSNQTFSELYGEIRHGLGVGNQVASIDYGAIPSGEMYVPLRARGPEKFLSRVEVASRQIGERGVMTQFVTISTAEPHTPQSAVDQAIELLSGLQPAYPTPEGRQFVAGWVTGILRSVPWEG